MTATNFRDLLAEAVARSFYVMQGGLDEETQPVVPNTVDHQVAHNLLARPVPWVDCPACKGSGRIGCPGPSGGGARTQRERDALGLRKGIDYCYGMHMGHPCPTCSGTGKATVAQLLAWGQAIADPIDSHGLSGDDDYEAVVWYRNRILDVQP